MKQSQMDNQEKLATWGTQDEKKPTHNTNTNNVNKTRVLLHVQTTGGTARCPVTGDLQIALLFC